MRLTRWLRRARTGVAIAAVACSGSLMSGPRLGSRGSVVDVSIRDFAYSPATITISAGTTVRWTNTGPSAHTTTSDAGIWDSGTINPRDSVAMGGMTASDTFSFTFAQAGIYGYHCTIHPPSLYPGFTGTVTVTP
jgi:plastocyanin